MSNRTNRIIGILSSAAAPPVPPADMYIAYGMFTAPSGGNIRYAALTPSVAGSLVRLTAPNDGFISNLSTNTFNASGSMYAIARDTAIGTPFLRLYSRSDTAIANLTVAPSIPTNIQDCAFSPSGTNFVVAFTSSPFIRFWSVSGTTFTLLSDPAALPNAGGSLTYSPDGNYLVVSSGSPDYLVTYSISGNTYTAISLPSPALEVSPRIYGWSANSQYFAMLTTIATVTNVYIYEIVANVPTNIGTITGAPSMSFANPPRFTFSPDNVYAILFIGSNTAYLVKRTGSTFAVVATVTNTTAGVPRSIFWTADGVYVVLISADPNNSVNDTVAYHRVGDTLILVDTYKMRNGGASNDYISVAAAYPVGISGTSGAA